MHRTVSVRWKNWVVVKIFILNSSKCEILSNQQQRKESVRFLNDGGGTRQSIFIKFDGFPFANDILTKP